MAVVGMERLDERQVYQSALQLLDRNDESYLATIDAQGKPAIRGMMIWRRDGLRKIWYVGLSSSRKIQNLANNPSAGVYVWDNDQKVRALALTGTARMLTDSAVKQEFWKDSLLKFYNGPDDPEYCVLEFIASECDYRQDDISYVFTP